MEAIQVLLPHGLQTEGGWQQTVVLRTPNGWDEEFLAVEACRLSPSRRSTALLGRCLSGLPLPRLVVGDRDYLLLWLRQLTLGDRIVSVATCPASSCGSQMDVEIGIAALLDRSVPVLTHELQASASTDTGEWSVRFRLPVVEDIEVGAELAGGDPKAAVALVLNRCVLEASCNDRPASAAELPESLIAAIEDRILEADPFAETVLSLSCPECGTGFRLRFDPGDHLLRELSGQDGTLLREVHALALNYHWSEAEILGLSRPRRQLYLELCDESIGGAAWTGF